MCEDNTLNKKTKEWIESIIEALIIVVILYFLFWPVSIQGESMENTFFDGDKVIISRILTGMNFYEHGDFIIFSAFEGKEEINLIKRVIAFEGERITIHNSEVTVNGIKLNESYTVGKTEGDLDLVVPKGCVFVLGDKREHSTDSRILGPIEKNRISGKVIIKWFPIESFKIY